MAPNVKYIFFDFMGTCLDWHSSVVAALPVSISAARRSEFALRWRVNYFKANQARAGQPPEDIDITLRRTLDELLDMSTVSEIETSESAFPDDARAAAVQAWHTQKAWSDVEAELIALREAGYETFVLANGTTRLQLDLVRSSGLRGYFDLLLSSQLLGVYKPDEAAYKRAVQLMGVDATPDQCVQVAAHAYDTAGAKKCGFRTVYIDRWTDDVHVDKERVKGENQFFLEGMKGLAEVIKKMG